MADGAVTSDDIAPLLTIVEKDEDRRCREAALRAVAHLPLAVGAAEQATSVVRRLLADDPRWLDRSVVSAATDLLGLVERAQAGTPVPAAEQAPARRARAGTRRSAKRRSPAQARELADAVMARLFEPGGFPADLAPLGALSDEDARRLLTVLVEQMLRSARKDEPVLDAATKRLSRVAAALAAGGHPAAAGLPDLGAVRVPKQRRTWVGGLLTLVEPGQVLNAAQDRITSPDSRQRRTALRRLADVADRLGRPRLLLPSPAGAAGELAGLVRLVEPPRSGSGATLGPAGRPLPGPAPPLPPPPRADPRSFRRAPTKSAPPTRVPLEPEPAGEPPADTRTVYARLDAPEQAAPGDVIELRVGLAKRPSRRVRAPVRMNVPTGEFTLTIQLVAEGFRLLSGGSLTRTLTVSPEDPYPYDVLRLKVEDDPELAVARTIVAVFLIDGRMIGVASRAVLVTRSADEAALPAAPPQPDGVDWVLPADPASRPDLEILVAPGNDAVGARLSWFFRSPHASVGETAEPIPSRFDESGSISEWARQVVMRGIEDRKEAEDLGEYLSGIGDQVRSAIPAQVWAALRAVAQVSSPPTVLLATWEPHVPWELALVPEPWDADSPDFLAAQAVVGRWPYLEQVRSAAPPPTVEARSMAVVSGEYPGGLRLLEAEQEAADLRRRYRAAPVKAGIRPVLDCLKGNPRADLVHFALHGKFDRTGTQDGILMVNKKYLSPISVRGVKKSAVGVVFLNACQLGQGQRTLGEYAGMAAALIGRGIGAVVAPLWKVDDAVAREVAQGFYAAMLQQEGLAPAEFLRQERRSTTGREGSAAGTRLAYLFFGHPRLRVSWKGPLRDA